MPRRRLQEVTDEKIAAQVRREGGGHFPSIGFGFIL